MSEGGMSSFPWSGLVKRADAAIAIVGMVELGDEGGAEKRE